jgi:hypothetical protein
MKITIDINSPSDVKQFLAVLNNLYGFNLYVPGMAVSDIKPTAHTAPEESPIETIEPQPEKPAPTEDSVSTVEELVSWCLELTKTYGSGFIADTATHFGYKISQTPKDKIREVMDYVIKLTTRDT